MVGRSFSIWLMAIWGMAAVGASGLAAPKKQAVAVIAGTVFRDPGFSFPAVLVQLEPKPDPATSSTQKRSAKVKKMKAVSDSRGEFGFRVPATPMRYTLTFEATGHRPETREVTISGEERQDIYVTLKPAKEGPQ